MGGGVGGVVDGLVGDADLGVGGEVVAGVEVAVEAGEVGGGDFEADAVAALEDVGGDADFDFVLLDGAGR